MAEGRSLSVRLRSTTARIAIALLAVQLASVGTALLVIRNATDASLASESRDFVREMQLDLQDAFREGGYPVLQSAIAQRVNKLGGHDAAIGLRDAKGRILAGNLQSWPASIEKRDDWHVVHLQRKGDEVPVEMGISVWRLPDRSVLVSGDALEEEQRIKAAGERALVLASWTWWLKACGFQALGISSR
mgnify:CR=1 FL=1